MFLGDQPPLHPKGGFQMAPNLGILSIYAYTLYCGTTKFDEVTYR